jgi:membrane-associated protease RseP (regulator of RpoE activity)
MKLTKLSLCFALASSFAGGISSSSAQEAQPRKGVQTIRVVQGEAVQGQDPASPQANRIQIGVEGQKLIIVGKDGKQQEIQLPPGGGSITVTQQAEETNRDGKVDRKATGKAVIVGPNGEKQEIELGGGGFGFDAGGAELEPRLLDIIPGKLPAGISISKYFIGVHCEPVDEETRAKLRLGEKNGLQVLEVTTNSPAETAGLKSGDILLYANDSELGNREQLIEAVQKAGESKAELALSIIRDEKEEKVVVRPGKRPDFEAIPGMMGGIQIMGEPGEMGADLDLLRKQMEEMKVQVFRAGPEGAVEGFAIPMPGIIREDFGVFVPEQMEDFKAQMAEARQQLEQARGEMEKAQVQIREEMQRAQQEIRQQLDEARKQLERAVEELRKTKAKNDG